MRLRNSCEIFQLIYSEAKQFAVTIFNIGEIKSTHAQTPWFEMALSGICWNLTAKHI